MKRLSRLSGIVLLCFMLACGASSFATQFRTILAAGAPVLTILVQQGKITEAFRFKLVTDLDLGASHVGEFGDCLEGATDKVGKLRCTKTLEGQVRPILERNFKTNETVRFIADDIEAIIDAAIIFYGGESSRVRRGGRSTSQAPPTEKEIKLLVERLKKDLGQ